MGRRTVLLIVAALIAALGTGMVFLYVRGADNRAEANQQPVQVLKAVARSTPGETMGAAQAAGKIQVGTVPREPGALRRRQLGARAGEQGRALDDLPERADHHRQVRRGRRPEHADDPRRRHRDLGHPVRHGPRRGLREPRRQRRDLHRRPRPKDGRTRSRLLLPTVQVIAVGATTVVSTTTTDPAGAQTTEQLPKTLFTLAVPARTTPSGSCTPSGHGDLTFASAQRQVQGQGRSGRHQHEPLPVI